MLKFRYKTVEVAAAVISGLALMAPAAPAGRFLETTVGATAAHGISGGAAAASGISGSATAVRGTSGGATAASGISGSATAARGFSGTATLRLQDALLTPVDLPRGYAPTMSGYTGTIAGMSTDTNICDHKISSHGQGATAQA